MHRMLIDRASGKTWSIQRNDSILATSTGGRKPREKQFDNAEQAAKQMEKEIWQRLKKGMIYHNLEVSAGEPVLQLYLGKGYTGFLPFVPIPGTNSSYVGYVIGQFQREEIYLIDEYGGKQVVFELGENHLVYDMYYCPYAGELVLNDCHSIRGYEVESRKLKLYSEPLYTELAVGNTLSLSGDRVLWYHDSKLIVYDLIKEKVVCQIAVNCEVYGGHSTQLCAALSHSGDKFAYCTNSREVKVYDIASGQEVVLPKSIHAMTTRIIFSPDDHLLFTQEQYGHWDLLVYDWQAKEKCEDWQIGETRSCAIHAGKGLVAAYDRGKVRLYELVTKRLVATIVIEHVVKSCNIAFTEDYLAVYTDYGCFSLYAL
ncbi:hypothetical protein ACIGHG_01685 [Bacillus sp. NPDC077411]|uniref:hypothetical protein n=1 Tax=Bacillus sp. NPDC077411 TaxID=3363947 RepID=UPI0037CCBB75